MRIDIFDIPVYSISAEEHQKTWENSLANKVLKDNAEFYKENPEFETQARHALIKEFGNWRFSRIIGYLRLYILGTQIRGEYYKSRKPKKKSFELVTHKLAPEMELPLKLDNVDIFKQILSYISKCTIELNKNQRKKKYVDSSLLERIGAYTDWKELIRGAKLQQPS